MDTSITVSVKLNHQFLETSVLLNTLEHYDPSEVQYTYILKKDGLIIQRIDRITDNKYTFELLEYGQYWVQACCIYKNQQYWKNSQFAFFIESYPKQYAAFLKEPDPQELPPLQYFKPSYLFQDFCIFWGKEAKGHWSAGINALQRQQKLCLTEFNLSKKIGCKLLTTRPLCSAKGLHFAFSGITRTATDLLIGDEDIKKHNVDPLSLIEQTGDYFLIYQDDAGLQITHDYLGLSKVYYYQDKRRFIASNRYHMLLLALKSVNIYPRVNLKRAIADLSSVSAFARLNYSRDMIMKNTHVLTIDQTVTLSATKVIFNNTSLHDELYNPEPYSEEKYYDQLRVAKDELIDNMQIALKYPGYKRYKVDLSGGIDSRLVFAALTNMLEFKDMIYIHTLDLPNYPLDLTVALALNSMYNFQYDTIPSFNEPISFRKLYNDIISSYLGINQQPTPSQSYICDEQTIKLPGFLGVLVCRPHMYTKFKGTPEEDNITIDSFVDSREYYHIEAVSKKGMKYYQDFLKAELKKMPGRTPMAKLQNHYLFFMETIHHSTYFTSSVLHTPIWTPLQSKMLFHLNNVTGMIFRSNRLAFDIMHLLNPAIAAIPYEKELYNNRKEKTGSRTSRAWTHY
ncbi:MAG: hypothetical protein ACOX88_00700 [Christensenellales bacterium]|jgi:hypothetical protein